MSSTPYLTCLDLIPCIFFLKRTTKKNPRKLKFEKHSEKLLQVNRFISLTEVHTVPNNLKLLFNYTKPAQRFI